MAIASASEDPPGRGGRPDITFGGLFGRVEAGTSDKDPVFEFLAREPNNLMATANELASNVLCRVYTAGKGHG